MKRTTPKSKGTTVPCWFVGRIITAYVPLGAFHRPTTVCQANSVIVLVSAINPSNAFLKLEKIGKFGEGKCVKRDGRSYKQQFIGIGDLSPVYETLDDGSDLYDEGWRRAQLATLHQEIPQKKCLLKEIDRIEKHRRNFGCAPMWGDGGNPETREAKPMKGESLQK